MKVLSLFDGMACGMIAMQLAGVEVESYDAYEIDKYAIKTAQHNFPMIKEHGDVFGADFTQYDGVDFLIGGSPCTYWSIAQTKNRETVASGMGWELFSQYVRALHEAKPKYFIYENNKSMSKAIRASIDETFGFEAVLINSALVSAQNRQRLYWVGKCNEDGTYSKVDVEQPVDRGILLKDVLDNAVAWREKAYTIDANYYKATDGTDPFGGHQSNNRMMAAEPLVTTKNGKSFAITANYVHIQDYPNDYAAHTIEKSAKPLVAEPVNTTQDGKAQCLRATYYKVGIRDMVGNTFDRRTCVATPACIAERGRYTGDDGKVEQHFEAREDGKTNTITTVQKDNYVAEPVRNVGHVTRSKIYEVKDGLITVKGKQYPIKLQDGYYIMRKLTVRECMRLQTVPECYEFPVSDSQAYKMLGNGWTVDVIAHILKGLKEA